MKYLIYTILLTSLINFSFANEINSEYLEKGYSDIHVSPSGKYLVFSKDDAPGIYLFDIKTNDAFLIGHGIGSAYHASFSQDERYIGFKLFKKIDEKILQVPALYDFENKKIIELAPPSSQTGIPSFSADEKVAFTVGTFLILKDLNTSEERKFELPNYSNLTPLSPDGSKILFNDMDDQICLFDLDSNESRKLTTDDTGYYEPIWSPNGSAILMSSFGGNLNIYDFSKNEKITLGPGNNPQWINNGNEIIFSRPEFSENREVVNMDLYSTDKYGDIKTELTSSPEWESFPAYNSTNNTIYLADRFSGKLLTTTLYKQNSLGKSGLYQEINVQFVSSSPVIESFSDDIELNTQTNSTAVLFDIPYVHQRYDTPDWFDGNWACGATSASMCLAYYGLIDPWPVTVSTPYSHISDYGNYICEIYSYNDYTFDIWASDPQGNKGYGGYGFIVRNGSQAWADTKGYMAEYARKHGLESGVDWNPSRAKLMNEADLKLPFVLLNSLTTSGHYISVIGYENDATTVIVNDPYGDKNRGYTNYYGRRAKYDWPGYSNGYSNLNTVWCFIYFRGHVPGYADLAVESIQIQDSCKTKDTIPFSAKIFNHGDSTSTICSLKYIISPDSVYDDTDSLLAIEELPALGTGDSIIVSKDLLIPDSLLSGIYYIGVFADAEKNNLEVMRENNFGKSAIVVCGYPEIYSVFPRNGELVTDTANPEIKVKFREMTGEIDTSEFKLMLDGIDITDRSDIDLRKAVFTPANNLTNGLHLLSTSIINNFGNRASYNWKFTIDFQTALGESDEIPDRFVLKQNYPNPFNPVTTISYSIDEPEIVALDIYNILGQHVADLVNKKQLPGNYTVSWDAADFPSGIYFIRLISGTKILTRKMILRK